MTLHHSSPRAKSRWTALFVMLATLSVIAAGLAFAHVGVTDPPARYAGGSQVDSDPPPAPSVNDEPGQVDMTRMGRDTSANPNIQVFWSWDAISAWTGKGQTGDACALFDTDDTDANINYVVCARVSNPNANTGMTTLLPAAANKPVYLFDCSNAKNDRCTNPSPRAYAAGQVLAGPLLATRNVTQTGTGNLQNDSDPFGPTVADGPGEAYPHDTSIEIWIDGEGEDSLVPDGVRLANVCSYPSAGNGGNNNPFDCIVTPGVQYGTLIVNKTLTNDNGGTATVGSFSFTVGSGSATTGVVASTAFTPSPSTSTTNGSNSVTLPVGTYSVAEVGLPITGYTTTTPSTCTSISVTAGGTATCTITNNDNIAAPSIATVMKWTLQDRMVLTGYVSGGTGTNTATFTLFKDTATLTNCEASTQVSGYTPEVINVIDTGTSAGTAATLTGYTTEVAGTYHWIVTYSGNSRNAGTSTPCTGTGSEITTLP